MLAGCSSGPDVSCPTEETELHPGLTCARADDLGEAMELIASRPITGRDKERLRRAIAARYDRDAVATEAWLASVDEIVADLAERRALDAAEARSLTIHKLLTGEGPFGPSDEDVWNIFSRALSVWERDDSERLVLTEMDIEGWIFYASLCRELQNGGPLKVSVSDRVTIYNVVRDRFKRSNREEKIAILAVGPFWNGVREAWEDAGYGTQQRFVSAAPLPPPMTATSLGYLQAIMDGNVRGHADALHGKLGPFALGVSR